MVDKTNIIESYLREFGVNDSIINYLRETRISLNSYFEDILGKDFYMWNDDQHKKEFFQKLKNGSEDFKIFDNGAIWFSTTRDPKIETGPSFIRNSGFISITEDKKYDKIKTSNYISFENGKIRKKTYQLKQKTIDNQIYYDGSITEEITDINSKSKIIKSSSFSDSKTIIPTDNLETTVERRNAFKSLEKIEFETTNYNNSIWYLVANGKIKNQNLIENLNSEKISTKEKFKLIKQNIFAKRKAKNQAELYQQLKEQEINMLDNENADEVIHSEFTIKGKDGKTCVWTLEKVTEISRETIFQIEFQNTEQFREQILLPLLITFAQSNSVMKGRISPTNEESFQYRAYSTSNNALTVNNISKEFAEQISREIKKVEPTIYHKKMEQKEREYQQQKEKEVSYQKVMKKSGGFLDVLLLTSIVGLFSLLLLFIMLIIFKNNL